MVLPLLPVFDDIQLLLNESSQSFPKHSINIVGQVLLKGSSQDAEAAIKLLPNIPTTVNVIIDFGALSLDQLINFLDAGAEKVVVSKSQLNELSDIPPGRLISRLSEAEVFAPAGIEEIASRVSGVMIDSSYSISVESGSLCSIVQSLRKSLLLSGGERTVYMEYRDTTSPPTVAELKPLALLSILPVLPQRYLTSSPKEYLSLLSVSQIALLGAKTDRADGLYPTLVVDERGHSLGLVYSSAESIAESIKTGKGVYQSRQRGLWYKGETSGATQQVLGISWDCDSDCLQFKVKQAGKGLSPLLTILSATGFCHLERSSCFGSYTGLSALEQTLKARKEGAPEGSYVARLFSDPALLRSKIMEEAEEVCDANTSKDIAWEVADLLFFAMTKCVANGVSLTDVEAQLDKRANKVTRRKGDAKPRWTEQPKETSGTTVTEKPKDKVVIPTPAPSSTETRIKMPVYSAKTLSSSAKKALLSRPIQKTAQIMPVVQSIIDTVKSKGDLALLEYTAKFEKANLSSPALSAPFPPELMDLPESTRNAIDTAFANIKTFHASQLDGPKHVQTMPGITCSRFPRPIEKVGLYVPGGTAVLPSTAMMLGIPALVAGCKNIQFATPPRQDGTVVPEIVYIAHKVGASKIVLAGGAQAIAALAYGTESVEKCDKIFGPGNQYVTAAKLCVQSDASALVGVDLPAGPSEVLV